MQAARYLQRIHYTGPFEPTLATLRGLHAAHMYAVPFENLDIVPLHRPILLDEASLWRKIVEERRGGFCYELNGLFAWLLKQAGFGVTYLNARVFSRDGKLGIDFDHLALLVTVPGEDGYWLADVGFGDSFTEPLRLEAGDQPQGPRAYRLERAGEGFILWQRNYDGAWEREYFFDLLPRLFPADYEAGCLYHQRSPVSSFTRSSVVSRATPNGRISLQEERLVLTENSKRREQQLRPGQWRGMLKEHFGIEIAHATGHDLPPDQGGTRQAGA